MTFHDDFSDDFNFEFRQWLLRHCIKLFKTRRMIYNMTQKSQTWNLTSGQGHDLTQIGHVEYHSIRIDERNAMVLFWSSLYHASIKSY